MTIEAKVICDSISPDLVRLTTLQLRYPKFIHSEFMTHRVFSRNASSSRAIPTKRLLQDIWREPANPVYWGANKPGMQAATQITGWRRAAVRGVWRSGQVSNIIHAWLLDRLGLHKQLVNRRIENDGHINVVVTATEWDNFFKLRCHKDAQPEIQTLAREMLNAMNKSRPTPREQGQWHLPYVTPDFDIRMESLLQRKCTYGIKVSVARCARVSYLTHNRKPPEWEEDIKLYERLVGAEPLHASPAEHQATPDKRADGVIGVANDAWTNPELHGNLTGWIQYRKILEQPACVLEDF